MAGVTSVSYTHLDVYKRQIGDNLNDYAMLKDAGVAVAVANAVAEIQAISDYVTKANCNEDAVAEAIQKFIFAS